MQEINLEENQNFNCPVCGTTILDYETGEVLVPCSHILLMTTPALDNVFSYCKESMKLIAEDIINKIEVDSCIFLSDCMQDYTAKSNGKIEIYAVNSDMDSSAGFNFITYIMVQN